jgi:hypothetical protein
MISKDIMEKSLSLAQGIFEKSHHLRSVGAKAEYLERDEYLQKLVGENGYISFHPTVSDEILGTFQQMFKKDFIMLREEYHKASTNDDYDIRRFRYYAAEALQDNMTSKDLLDNTVPMAFAKYVKYYATSKIEDEKVRREARQLMSPKLSKILVKLFGEQSEIVKWYTCKCPKKLTKGINRDWTVTLSILPHHIAGMSYYGSYNWGGPRWKEGYEGTSCMDPKRNGTGSNIFSLVPSMKDVTMAVAYLSCAEDDDIWQPIYQARCLVRVVYINDKPQLVICRPYFTSNDTMHILVDGLKNQFENAHFVRDIRRFSYSDTRHEMFTYYYSDDIMYYVNAEIKCDQCEGMGTNCNHCDGDGSWFVEDEFLPYIDDDDIISVYGDLMEFTFPVPYLESRGIDWRSEEEDVEEQAKAEHSKAPSIEQVGVNHLHDEVTINIGNARINVDAIIDLLTHASVVEAEAFARTHGLYEVGAED